MVNNVGCVVATPWVCRASPGHFFAAFMFTVSPPFCAPSVWQAQLRHHGFAVIAPPDVGALCGAQLSELQALSGAWADLPPDEYLKDGGRYRSRRHGSYVVQGDALQRVAHRAHWQPLSYNALHGGMERWFAPIDEALDGRAAWCALLRAAAHAATVLRGEQPWFVEAHQFRIDTRDGIGRPTPEGAHRDGVDLVLVALVARHAIKGGETRVFDAQGPMGQRFTLTEPWSLMLLDDQRVIHESTPIQPEAELGWRDTLVLTVRAGGFQDAPTAPSPA